VKTSHKERQIVNVSLLKSFVSQVKLKFGMLLIQKKHGFITLNKSEDNIFQDVVSELILFSPNECESALV
jgi:hypothetical protein